MRYRTALTIRYPSDTLTVIGGPLILMVVALLRCSNSYAQATPNPLSSFMEQLKQRLQQATEGQHGASGPGANSGTTTVIDRVGLRNILPEYDPSQSIAEQYPHVAVTVLNSPSHWMSPPTSFSGCWTLSAVVWSNAQSSKEVGPFDWCMPADQQIRLGPMAVYGLPTASYLDIYHDATTGIHRTTGPKPPNSIIPDDIKTHNLEAQDRGIALDLPALYSTTAFGTMFGNLLYALGKNLGAMDDHDCRVWIVTINQ
jgi:hypothetical protein